MDVLEKQSEGPDDCFEVKFGTKSATLHFITTSFDEGYDIRRLFTEQDAVPSRIAF